MEYVRLGSTGLKVSRLALGCMSYGDPTAPGAHEWSLVDDQAQPFFQQAIELGITFWDTANVYQAGTSEEVVGRAIKRYSRREDIVLATKVFGRMHDGPGGQGLSRKAILEQIDASLKRLGTDYVDLYQIHRFDPDTPAEETMEALHDIVKAGKVRYIGASSMYGWQFGKLQHAAELGGWTRFVSMQNQYNLLRRQDEPELMATCADMGVGLVPYSPNGKGRLARPWGQESLRSSVDKVVQAFDAPRDEPVVNAVEEIAGRARREHGPGRTGLGADQPDRLRADPRRDQAAPPPRGGRGAEARTHAGGDHDAGGAIRQRRAVLVLSPSSKFRSALGRLGHQTGTSVSATRAGSLDIALRDRGVGHERDERDQGKPADRAVTETEPGLPVRLAEPVDDRAGDDIGAPEGDDRVQPAAPPEQRRHGDGDGEQDDRGEEAQVEADRRQVSRGGAERKRRQHGAPKNSSRRRVVMLWIERVPSAPCQR